MEVLTVVGARPQFIKAAPVSRTLRELGHTEFLLHTGQHYDRNMSHVFFEEMGIPRPDANLEIGSASHGRQTGQMLIHLEEVMKQRPFDCVLVYGDTNSTLAAALAACKLHIPLAHVEAGLRSFNRTMPEEHNRVLTDHCSDLLFCPTPTAVANLEREGIVSSVYLVGDTMFDAALQFAKVARQCSTIMSDLALRSKCFLLATIHRPYNTDEPDNLRSILNAFYDIDETIVYPVHPRSRQKIADLNMDLKQGPDSKVKMIEPLGYLDMLVLEQNARMILTDSGGMQKEAFFFGVPCVTLRSETEWIETVKTGWNLVVGADQAQIVSAVTNHRWPSERPPNVFGDGHAAHSIVTTLAEELPTRG